PHPPIRPLFPYPTLFRSLELADETRHGAHRARPLERRHGDQLTERLTDRDLHRLARRAAERGEPPHGIHRRLEVVIARRHPGGRDRKSTRLNSSHRTISY